MANSACITRMAALVAALVLVSVSCADERPTADPGASTDMTAVEPSEMSTDDTMSEPSGRLCSSVSTTGDGSFEGMADDPAAVATSNNPALSTLSTAVGEAGLVDTLNGTGPFTIFAPVNAAFEAIPRADLDVLLADKDALTNVLTFHVVAGERLSSADLRERDSVDTVQGTTLSLGDEGGMLRVNGQATVGCADVQTANATVHLIDAVLMPTDG